MPKRPTIVTLAAAMLIISATFANRASAASNSTRPVLQSITVSERDMTELKNGKRKKEFQGVAGVVASVSGSVVTLQGKDNTVYVVDTQGAEIKKRDARGGATLRDIRSGDKLFVRGTILDIKPTEVLID